MLDLRRQQAEIERAKLQSLSALQARLEAEKVAAGKSGDAARAHVKQSPSSGGDDFMALNHYETYIRNYRLKVDARMAQAAKQIVEQRAVVVESERKVKLLEELEERSRTEWTAAHNKELEELAADAFTARIMSQRRHSEI